MLVVQNGVRLTVAVTRPGFEVVYRFHGRDYFFDLSTIDEALRFVYRQRLSPAGDSPA